MNTAVWTSFFLLLKQNNPTWSTLWGLQTKTRWHLPRQTAVSFSPPRLRSLHPVQSHRMWCCPLDRGVRSFFFFLVFRIKAWIHCTEDNQCNNNNNNKKRSSFCSSVFCLGTMVEARRPRVSFPGFTSVHHCWLRADVGWEVISANYPSYRVYIFR